MNEKEALQNIRQLTKHLENDNDCLVDTFRLAIIALNKQVPKKPDYENDGYYDTWICPNCGQRLDWEENHAESC